MTTMVPRLRRSLTGLRSTCKVVMFAPKTYIVVCHGCGKFYEKVSSFLSAPIAVKFPASLNGTSWVVPNLACPECMKTPEVVREAYLHGMSPAARERAFAEFPQWEPRLKELH